MIAAFSITPLGGDESVGAAVAEAVRLVRRSGLPNETNAMFTNVEGDWEEVMGLIKACLDKVSESAPRVSLVIKVDHRPGATGALRHKVESVERHLADPPSPGPRAAADDDESMEETDYLLRSPANAARLTAAADEMRQMLRYDG